MFSYLDAARAIGANLQHSNASSLATGASIDSRKLELGELFVALKGQNCDGHQYLEEVFRKGASGALISKDYFRERLMGHETSRVHFQNLLVVDDPESALRELAVWYRSKLKMTVIGITGSVGKTSTKEMVTYLLKKRYPTLASPGNYNNHLGLPLTILSLQPSDRYCVAEMGANHLGEIRLLTSILKPTAAILTRIAPAHIEGFGSLRAIYDAKLEIAEHLLPESPFVLPADDPEIVRRTRDLGFHTVYVGMQEKADFRITNIDIRKGRVCFTLNKKHNFFFPSKAAFLAENAAMAVALVQAIGIEINDLPKIWDDLELPAGRFQERHCANGLRLIYDGYNANPVSFQRALDSFKNLEVSFGSRKILVMADMLELGEDASFYHQQLGRQITNSSIDLVFAFGTLAKETVTVIDLQNVAVYARHYPDADSLFEGLKNSLQQGDVILLKGSRGMRVEKIMDSLEKIHFPQPLIS